MGRHRQVDCFYLSQTSKIPKQLVRNNANLLVIFKQDDRNLSHIYNEHVNTDMEWYTFKQLCSTIWHDQFSFLLINKYCAITQGRYGKGFDTFFYF